MSGAEFARYARDLAQAAAGIDSLADLAAFRTAKAAADTARSVAPEKSGALKRGIRVVRRKDGAVAVESSNFYAAFQEFGTSRMAPNPFIGPAATKHSDQLVREVEKIRDGVLRKF